MSEVVIVTGMHRSGTSFTTSIMRHAGVHVGDDLLTPDGSNKRGYFEDLDFWRFQEDMLRKRGLSYLVTSLDPIVPDEDEVAQARRLVAAKARHPRWGWKDPRTCLFLDLWAELLPSAKFIFVYRHPVDVALSLMRATERQPGRPPTIDTPMAALPSWRAHNERLLRFAERHPDRCVLCAASGIMSAPESFARLLVERFGFTADIRVADVYHPEDFTSTQVPTWFAGYVDAAFPGVLALYDALQAHADLPAPDAAPADDAEALFVKRAVGAAASLHKKLLTLHLELEAEHQRLRDEHQRIEATRARRFARRLDEHPGLKRTFTAAFEMAAAGFRQYRKLTQQGQHR